jgi:hypothetical protein
MAIAQDVWKNGLAESEVTSTSRSQTALSGTLSEPVESTVLTDEPSDSGSRI